MPSISNRQLVEELRLGNRQGSLHLVQMYQRCLLFECVQAFGIHPLDSEEIVNDVLVTVVKKIDTFSFKRSDSDFHFWVMTILRNKIRDFVRRRINEPAVWRERQVNEFEEDKEIILAAIREFERSLTEDERENPLMTLVMELLDEMEPWERVLLRCRAMEVPYGDIARYTGKSTDQLKVYHSRVKRKLRRMIAERRTNGEASEEENRAVPSGDATTL